MEKTKLYDAIYVKYNKLSVHDLKAAFEKQGVDKDDDINVLREMLGKVVERKALENMPSEET